jgi:hypothetical protein
VRSSSEPDGFAEWYAAYPRRIGRDAAAKKYEAAVKAGASPVELMTAVQSATWSADPQYIPHPATWLGQGRWKDQGVAPDYRAARPAAFARPGKTDWMHQGDADSGLIIDMEDAA